MAHLLLSLSFIAIMAVAMKSIAHDLTRPLVMQPWDNGDVVVAPAATAVAVVERTAHVAGQVRRPAFAYAMAA